MIGTTLSHFRITAKLGEGGMGEVYRAEDTKLGREVAIKVLPEAVAQDPERLARFEREAKVLASLNHPNIAAIYSSESATQAGSSPAPTDAAADVGEGLAPSQAGSSPAPTDAAADVGEGLAPSERVHFLVMELVEGEDLKEKLDHGALPIEQALPVARQIAEALDFAHERSIVHRDLKPANIKITPDGQVKVLDFGLAKAVAANSDVGEGLAPSQEGASPSPAMLSLSPTLTAQMTGVGVLIGTAAYMSPEQARGQEASKQADIWSFGVVVWEMLCGRRLFAGPTVSDTLAEILKTDPDLDALPEGTPASIQRLLRRCLERDTQRRLRDIGDARLELAEALEEEPARPESTPSSSGSILWKGLAAVFALAAVALGALWYLGRSAPPTSAGSPKIEAMSLITDFPGWQGAPSLSPDGSQLLYVAEDGGDKDIFLLRVGGENALNLTADSPGLDHHPAWSPDGQRIAFDSDREGGGIFVMGATGESPLRVSAEGFHPAWSPDGKKILYSDENILDVFSRASTSHLTVLDLDSGERRVLPAQGDAAQGQWSPDGRIVAYWTSDGGQRDVRTILSEGTDTYVSITDDPEGDWGPIWSPDGKWLYFLSNRGGSPDLWRVLIDSTTGAVAGPLQNVTSGVAEVVSASVAANGQRVAIGVEKKSSSIERLAFDPVSERPVGEPEMIFFSNNAVVQTDLSNDEEWLAYRSTTPQDDIFIMRVDGSSRRRLTNSVARDRGPVWSADGEWLIFYSNRTGIYDHYLMRRDGTDVRQLTDNRGFDINDPIWSHDGARVAALNFNNNGTTIYDFNPEWLDPSSTAPPIPLETTYPGFAPSSWSPDDRYLLGHQGPTVLKLGVLEVETGEIRLLSRPDDKEFSWWWDAAWIDNRRAILWEVDLGTAFIVDVETGEARPVPGVPGPSGFEVADQGRTLYLSRLINEADVWMLTFSAPKGPAN